MEETFSRDDTKVIKGIAVILMLMHHLYAFPERLAVKLISYTTIFGQSTIVYLGAFGKICVSIFMFLGGYGAYKQLQKNQFDLLKKIKGLYCSYWKIFFIFIPIGFIFFSKQPIYCKNANICTKYSTYDWREFFNNLLGLSDSYNGEWGFFKSYICAMITFPLIVKIIDNKSTIINVWIVIFYAILGKTVLQSIGNLEVLGNLNLNFLWRNLIAPSEFDMYPAFWMGVVMSKGDLLVKTNNKLKELKMLNPIIDVIALAVIVYLRTSITNTLDIIYVPALIIFSLDFLRYCKPLYNILIHIGKKSTNMWLIHTFLLYYFYLCVKIILYPKYALLVLIWLIICTYVVSVLVDELYEKIKKIKNKIQYRNIKMLCD